MKKQVKTIRPRPKVVMTASVENIKLVVTENANTKTVKAAVKALEERKAGVE